MNAAPDAAALQRRTLRLLFASQMTGSVGVSVGMSVGALLAADMVSVGVSGLAQSAVVMGAALLAIPATRIVRRAGRGPSLSTMYAVAAAGAALTVIAATSRMPAALFIGFFLFGGATAANLQARFAAVDLAPAQLYGRHLSLVVWATTVGGVIGPNLSSFAGTSLGGFGLPPLAGPFVFSSALFVFAALLLFAGLRPDPFLVAQRAVGASTGSSTTPRAGMGTALRVVWANQDARLGIAAASVGHLVMVAVMSMTPVHIRGAGHDAAHTLRIVGIVISLHIAGMYAFSPVMGWLSDRLGRRVVILGGIVALVAACAVAGTAGHDTTMLAVGLVFLGLGWSATMIAGSALLSQSVPQELRPSAQGLSDLVMGLAAAGAGALSGVVVYAWNYPRLTLFAAIATLPLGVLALAKHSAPRAQP